MSRSLGLGMIVKDEESVLSVCLKSVDGLFDDLVIVDTGSTDNTIEIAKSFGARVLHFDWIDTYRPGWNFGFAAARNFCWENLHTDWKMWLDADDVIIGQENFDEMLAKLDRRPELHGVAIEYLYSFDSIGEKLLDDITPSILSRAFPFSEILKVLAPHQRCITTQFRERVVKNDPTWRWRYPIHEALSIVGHPLGKYDKIKVIHRRHVKKVREWTNRNWKLLQQIPETERDERIWFYLGLESAIQNLIDESIDAFKHYIGLSSVDDEKYFALHYLADLHRKKGIPDESRLYDLQAVALRPLWRDAYAGLLKTCVEQQDWKQALYYGTRCSTAEIPETPFAYNPLQERVGWVTDFITTLSIFGMHDEALHECERALQTLPEDPGLLQNMDLFASEINFTHGLESIADALDFFLRLDDAETAAMLISRLHPRMRTHPRTKQLVSLVDKACARAAVGEITEEPLVVDSAICLRAGEYASWADPRMQYLRTFWGEHPTDKKFLQIGGPIDTWKAYEELGIQAKRVERLAEIQGKYDVVTIWNGLERVKYPESLVEQAREAVRPGGSLIGFVSNGPSHRGLAPPDLVPIKMRAYSLDTFRQAMGTVCMPSILKGWSAEAGQLALTIPRLDGWPEIAYKRHIAIFCPASPEPWGPWSLDTGIGGSEEAVVRLSRAFVRRGHDVTVYGTGWSGSELSEQIQYKPITDYAPADILIGWRYPEIFVNQLRPLEAGWKALWLHDSIPKERVAQAAPAINQIWCISDYHASLYDGIDNVYKGRNGIDPWMFGGGEEKKRNPAKLVYVSTPFRGLDRLVFQFWPEIKKQVPEAELHAYYGWESADRMGVTATAKGAEFKQRITEAFEKDSSLVWHGRIGQKELYKEMCSAGVWAYPTTWKEEHCISAYMVQGAGAWPVVLPLGALPQSVVFGWKADEASFVSSVVDAINTEAGREKMATWIRRWCSWDDVAALWERLWLGLLA